MRIKHQTYAKGDTLIEVMFAFAIFALVAVGSLTIMNQGISAAQRSLEITLVRAQMDAQAEAIRYVHRAYVAAYQKDVTVPVGSIAEEWVKMTSATGGHGVGNASQFGQVSGAICPTAMPPGAFILNARTAKVEANAPAASVPDGMSLPPFAQVIYNDDSSVDKAYGLWVEAVPSDNLSNGTAFVDFHIRSCWSGAGSATPMTLGTIVRLYEPR